ncbi:MAG: hypothetical protein FJ292_03455 [Planctomycetes bacterium]|nr:hypothetical protein [Planctomycetota bacterium]
MSRDATTIPVGKPTFQCAASGEALPPGTSCVTTVRENGQGGFERLEFSQAAWLAGARPEGLLCWWKTVMPEPDAKRRLVLDDEAIEEVFDRLAEDDRPNRVAVRWLLAMILLRKKRLRHLRVESAEGVETWLFSRRGDAEGAPATAVVRPALDEEAIAALGDELGAVVSFDA